MPRLFALLVLLLLLPAAAALGALRAGTPGPDRLKRAAASRSRSTAPAAAT